ncbi:MAG TPA: hypothetical protein VI357_23085 [Mycobacteriales bacterium]
MATFLLLHPPLLGPSVWAPCAEALTAAGHRAVVPDLRAALDPPPGWPDRVATLAAQAVAGPAPVVAAHSGAGVVLPAVADRAGATAAVFVDAVLPGRPTADRLKSFLAGLPVSEGRLPRWSDWWGPDAMAEVVPDPDLRARIEADQPRLPLAFWDERVPVPASWPPPRVGYLQLSPAYDAEAAGAADQGWPVRTLPGQHLDLATRPADVAAEIMILAT